MNATLTTNYPEWQAKIRAAQQIANQERAVKLQQQIEAEAEVIRKNGENLMYVLNLLGIEIEEAPPINHLELNGYQFWLATEVTAYDNYQRFSIGPARHDPNPCIWFTLHVSKAPFPHQPTWDLNPKTKSLIVTGGKRIESDWTKERAELADLLDQLDEHYAAEVDRYNVWLMAEEAAQSKPAEPTPEPTPEEKLAKALRSIIRDIILDEIGEPFRGDDDQY